MEAIGKLIEEQLSELNAGFILWWLRLSVKALIEIYCGYIHLPVKCWELPADNNSIFYLIWPQEESQLLRDPQRRKFNVQDLQKIKLKNLEKLSISLTLRPLEKLIHVNSSQPCKVSVSSPKTLQSSTWSPISNPSVVKLTLNNFWME